MKNTTIMIGSARIDERGHTTGGKAGDQAREISTQPWYKHSKGWIVIRSKEAVAAERIAEAMERACANPRIGYDQAQRLSLWNAVKDKGFDPGKASAPCETDCSALVRVCCAYAGIITPNFTTADEVKTLRATGRFDILRDSKYTEKQSQLLRGDILCTKTKGHTAVVLSDGSKAEPRVISLGSRPLKRGCKGADVTELQRRLRQLSYNLGPYGKNHDGVDGDYGSRTSLAVYDFQDDYLPALKPTGEADTETTIPHLIAVTE